MTSPPVALVATVPLVGAAGRHPSARLAVLPIAAMAGVSVVLAATSDHVEHPTATAAYYGTLVGSSLLVALYWLVRRPGSRFGLLLAAFGLTAWVVSWQSSDVPLVFDVGVLAEGAGVVLTFWLFLAFPSGRLTTPANRLLIAGLTVAVLAFFVPWALLTPVIAGGGPLSGCRPSCPENVLQIDTNAGLVDFAGRWWTYAVLALVIAVLGVYWLRFSRASRPTRRTIVAVAATSLLFLPIFFVYHFSRVILDADSATLEPMGWALVGIRVVLPLGFLVALFQAELFAGTARGRLLEQLLGRPSPQEWRRAIATALDDPPLRIAFWDPATERYRETDGSQLRAPDAGSGRSIVHIGRRDDPVAAMVIDDALAEDPALVRAASSATILAVEHGNLEGRLQASQLRVDEVGAAERERIERNLHDSAQQRLIALRMHLELAGAGLRGSELRHVSAELDHVLQDVRSAASGTPPSGLARHGVAAALESLARSTGTSIAIDDRGLGRHPEVIETTVFYCCAEAVQNATKHAGPGTSIRVKLSDGDGRVRFSVEDDGDGFDPDGVARGRGLDNIAGRVHAAGGSVTFHSAAGQGTRVVGSLPVSAAPGLAASPASPSRHTG